jgi:drug/metabolite transporter (DMT)-like permease
MRTGIILVILSMTLTPGLDGVTKILGGENDPIFVCFARYLCAGLVALALARVFGEPVRLRWRDVSRQLLRAALLISAMCAFITALSLVPLADAVGGFLIAPIIATLLSAMLFNEAVSAEKMLGALLSLFGAIAIMKPGIGLTDGTMLALLGGVLLGGYLAASRGADPAEGALTALAVQSLLGSAMVAPFALADGLPEVSASFVGWILVLGLLSAATQLMTILAFRLAEASVLAPFMYFNLIAAVAVGLLWFGEVPTALTLFGLGAILAGGLVSSVDPQALQNRGPAPLAVWRGHRALLARSGPSQTQRVVA